MKIIQEREGVFFGDRYVRTQERIGLCTYCQREVYLDGFTNTCECGIDYNSAGQELAPREFWGEETGESYAEISRIK